MQALGFGTENFVTKIIGGFSAVLAIMETIKAVNSILSVIPFLATGGIMQSSGLAVVGERGPNWFHSPQVQGFITIKIRKDISTMLIQLRRQSMFM
jgi:hypothetical protein